MLKLGQVPTTAKMVLKGEESFVDAYSCFFDNLKQVVANPTKTSNFPPKNETMLSSDLEKDGVTDVFLCGLATDICVGKIIDKSI